MSKKDFKRGVEAAIGANTAFMHKQAEATAELGKRIVHKIDEQGKIMDIREKEWEQERRQQEAEELEYEVYGAYEELMEKSETIVEIFQQALYRLYGVLFEKENITFIEEPDYTYEGPSLVDRLEGAASSAKAFMSDYVEKNCK